jgi:hypothetical protein
MHPVNDIEVIIGYLERHVTVLTWKERGPVSSEIAFRFGNGPRLRLRLMGQPKGTTLVVDERLRADDFRQRYFMVLPGAIVTENQLAAMLAWVK